MLGVEVVLEPLVKAKVPFQKMILRFQESVFIHEDRIIDLEDRKNGTH